MKSLHNIKSVFVCLVTILATHTVALSQVQLGADITKQPDLDIFNSLDMPDSRTLAIGFWENDDNGDDAGLVRIHHFDGSSWVQKGQDLLGDTAKYKLGSSISMADSNTIAVGAPGSDKYGERSGFARVFKWDGVSWVQKGSDIRGDNQLKSCGGAVSMPDSNTVAVRSYNDTTLVSVVQIYLWDGTDWVQKGGNIERLYPDYFQEISMPDRNTIAIRKQGDFESGSVSVYHWKNSSWTIKGAQNVGSTCNSFSMPDSNTIAFGSEEWRDDTTPVENYVYIYKWDGNSWSPYGDRFKGEHLSEGIAYNVSMPDRNTIALGASSNDDNFENAGQVRVYRWKEKCNKWILHATIEGKQSGDFAGNDVIMPDSNTVGFSVHGYRPYKARVYSVSSTDLKTAVKNEINTSVKVFPNPVDDVLTVSLGSEGFYEKAAVFSAVSGQLVLIKEIPECRGNKYTRSNSIDIDIEKIAPGLYILELISESGTSEHYRFKKD